MQVHTRMKPFSELFTNNFFGIAFVAFICTQSIDDFISTLIHYFSVLTSF